MPKEYYHLQDYAAEDFPLWITCPVDSNIKLHNHDFTELVIIQAGYGVHFTEEDEYRVSAGNVFVIPPGMKHGYRDAKSLVINNIMFDWNRFLADQSSISEISGFHALFDIEPKFRKKHRFQSRLCLEQAQVDSVHKLTINLKHELEWRQPGYQAAATAFLTEILINLSRAFTRTDSGPYQEVYLLGRVISCLEQNYMQQIKLEDLAKIARMSTRNLQRYFKRATGRSPIDYLISIRVSHAQNALMQSNLSIANIALKTGFSDTNFFSRQFKKITGMTPREFRQKNRK